MRQPGQLYTKYQKYSIYAPNKKKFQSVVKNHNHSLFFKDILPLGRHYSALYFLSECVMRSIDTKKCFIYLDQQSLLIFLTEFRIHIQLI